MHLRLLLPESVTVIACYCPLLLLSVMRCLLLCAITVCCYCVLLLSNQPPLYLSDEWPLVDYINANQSWSELSYFGAVILTISKGQKGKSRHHHGKERVHTRVSNWKKVIAREKSSNHFFFFLRSKMGLDKRSKMLKRSERCFAVMKTTTLPLQKHVTIKTAAAATTTKSVKVISPSSPPSLINQSATIEKKIISDEDSNNNNEEINSHEAEAVSSRHEAEAVSSRHDVNKIRRFVTMRTGLPIPLAATQFCNCSLNLNLLAFKNCPHSSIRILNVTKAE